ncbi:hypothetical protein [Mesorhizobium sp. B2-8-9]|uniref:hypothetical protein n=1 Tax=Mesorhizobium sp. B2-8-9 TaxID=2589899 RepID=UPI00112A1812|nr:hypothetical protein [Mesorhizobium sp. B2-8-9]TPI75364.1 hypothetical protein FJ423_22610 [Mesorhizobium sp. B2-8-9]
MAAPLEIRNSPSGKILPAVGPFLLGGIFGFGALQGVASGANSGHVLWIALLGAACLGLGASIARGAFDSSVKVVLDSQGFRDARAGDVLVPWNKVRSMRLASGGKARRCSISSSPRSRPTQSAIPPPTPSGSCPLAGTSCIWKSPRSTCAGRNWWMR